MLHNLRQMEKAKKTLISGLVAITLFIIAVLVIGKNIPVVYQRYTYAVAAISAIPFALMATRLVMLLPYKDTSKMIYQALESAELDKRQDMGVLMSVLLTNGKLSCFFDFIWVSSSTICFNSTHPKAGELMATIKQQRGLVQIVNKTESIDSAILYMSNHLEMNHVDEMTKGFKILQSVCI